MKNLLKRLYNKYDKKYGRLSKTFSEDINYNEWIKLNEPSKKELNMQKKHKFDYTPKISIIVPMYNTPENFFRELVISLQKQTYSNFELCLGDASDQPNKYIQKLIKSDRRIKYKKLEKNEGISLNSNESLKLATGDFIALLDHDDLLSPDCLYEFVKVINENPEVEFIYSDEDKINEIGTLRYEYHFKPDFSLEMLRTNNYICHFSVFKKELMDKLIGFRDEFDGSQDYDIILRMTENVKCYKNIIHIPKVLYHWRIHNFSTAMNTQAKPYVYDSARKALRAHLKRTGFKNFEVVDGASIGYYKVNYAITNYEELVSIIIPNKNSREDLKRCIDSIIKLSTYKNYEIIIVENNSTENNIFEYYKEIEKNDKIKVIKDKDKGFNFSKINNFGVSSAQGKYLLFLNNDTEVIAKNWIEEMLSFIQRDDIGVVGAKLLYQDNTVQHASVVIASAPHGIAGHINHGLPKDVVGYMARASIVNEVSAVTAACLMIKKELFDQIGGFDENLSVSYNDVDLCLKVRKLDKRIIYNPYVLLYHYESKSRGLDNTPEKEERLNREANYIKSKWNNILNKKDPYFNINFMYEYPIYMVTPKKINYH